MRQKRLLQLCLRIWERLKQWSVLRQKSLFSLQERQDNLRRYHSVQTLTRAVRLGDKYTSQVWRMPTIQHTWRACKCSSSLYESEFPGRTCSIKVVQRFMNGLENELIRMYLATLTFYRLLMLRESLSDHFAGWRLVERTDTALRIDRKDFPNAKINNVYASTEAGTLFMAKGIVSDSSGYLW